MRQHAGFGDASFFRRTAISTKKINVNPVVYRGGIRL
uniref:Uncharacterized protein n=2 Tax=unclassified Microvirus TaxID=338099 RepID=A0AAU8B2M7_9VIRU